MSKKHIQQVLLFFFILFVLGETPAIFRRVVHIKNWHFDHFFSSGGLYRECLTALVLLIVLLFLRERRKAKNINA